MLDWVKRAEVDSGKRASVPTEMAAKLKALERENRELRQANEILRKASAYFAMSEYFFRSSCKAGKMKLASYIYYKTMAFSPEMGFMTR